MSVTMCTGMLDIPDEIYYLEGEEGSLIIEEILHLT